MVQTLYKHIKGDIWLLCNRHPVNTLNKGEKANSCQPAAVLSWPTHNYICTKHQQRQWRRWRNGIANTCTHAHVSCATPHYVSNHIQMAKSNTCDGIWFWCWHGDQLERKLHHWKQYSIQVFNHCSSASRSKLSMLGTIFTRVLYVPSTAFHHSTMWYTHMCACAHTHTLHTCMTSINHSSKCRTSE